MNIETSFKRTLAVLLLTLFPMCILAQNTVWDDYAMVLGKPVSVVFASEFSSPDSDQLVIGDWYRVDLDELTLIHGQFADKQVSVRLLASHRESIASQAKIYVLLDLTGDKPEALYWGVPRSIACFPRKLIETKKIVQDFTVLSERTNELCTNAEWFK